jgi:MFS family permease
LTVTSTNAATKELASLAISRGMVYPFSLAVIAVIVTVAALWVWEWSEERWMKLYKWETHPARRYRGYPYSALSSLPAWAVAAWLAALFALGLTLTVPEDVPAGWAAAVFLAALVAPMALPSAVYLFQRPRILVPPAARRLPPKGPERRTVKNRVAVPIWIDNPTLVLTGFASTDTYRDRQPAWEPESTFNSLTDAELEARRWLAKQGAGAQVEVIRLLGRQGKIVEVVTQAGIEPTVS